MQKCRPDRLGKTGRLLLGYLGERETTTCAGEFVQGPTRWPAPTTRDTDAYCFFAATSSTSMWIFFGLVDE